MIIATVVDIKDDGITVRSGTEYKLPISFFPKGLAIGNVVYVDENGRFRKLEAHKE